MSSFLNSIRRYGILSHVRSDYGGENIEVGRFMESRRGPNHGSRIQGSSVHNQRIERFHRDTTQCCLCSFYTAFNFMESKGLLDLSNDTDVFCLHNVFLSRLGIRGISASTEGNRSPYQIWIAGVFKWQLWWVHCCSGYYKSRFNCLMWKVAVWLWVHLTIVKITRWLY